MKWLGTQSRSISHGVPKVSTFTHYNKLTSRIVSKPLIGLTTLNQALIRTSTPNLMGVIWSESMINQAFQAYYSIEGCPSDRCVLSHERVEYMIGNIHQLNLLPRSPLTYSRESHLQPQELLRWRQRPRRLPPINLHSEKYIMILQTLELNYKKKKKKLFIPLTSLMSLLHDITMWTWQMSPPYPPYPLDTPMWFCFAPIYYPLSTSSILLTGYFLFQTRSRNWFHLM